MGSLVDWLNKNAAAVQAVSAVVILLLTCALIWITNKYRRDTAKMARVMARQLELATRPVLDIRVNPGEVRGDWAILAFQVDLFNNGELWVTIRSAKVTYWIEGHDQQARTTAKEWFSLTVGANEAASKPLEFPVFPLPMEARTPEVLLKFRVEIEFEGADEKRRTWNSDPHSAQLRAR